tara:strand:+ start:5260 stop:5691 length:432 start_codon:yes stop_codon:yes gene_type:complete
MPIAEHNTDQFVTYTQTFRTVKEGDGYTARKVQKDRYKHIHWLNVVTSHKEIILTYKTDTDDLVTTIASRMDLESKEIEWPDTPLTKEIVKDQPVLEDQYVRFYDVRNQVPLAIHIENVVEWTITRDELNAVIDNEYKATMYA